MKLWRSQTGIFFLAVTLLAPIAGVMFDLTGIVFVAQKQGAPSALGFFVMLTMLPSLVLMPFAGVLIDRYDKYVIGVWANALRFVLTVGLGLGALAGLLSPPLFYTIITLYYVLWYVSQPNMDGILKALLTPEEYLHGVSITQAASQGGNMGAALLAGGIIALFGIPASFFVVGGLIVIGSLCLLRLRFIHPVETPPALTTVGAYLRDLADGFRYISATRTMIAIALMNGVLFPFYMGINVLIAPFIFRVLHGTSFTLGVVDAACGVGSIIASGLCIVLPRRERLGYTYYILSTVALGLSLLAFTASRSMLTASLAYVVVGIFIGNMKVFAKAMLFRRADHTYIGRASSAVQMLNMGLGIVFALGAGFIGDHSLFLAYAAIIASLGCPLVLAIISALSERSEGAEREAVLVRVRP
ncbi:MAG: hypothetical protein QOI11_3941 [Candidatus Eremiobacteraeota bacterium]|nr:hypothetical protein [Candidatus Eremiobacteraeota bacterium]